MSEYKEVQIGPKTVKIPKEWERTNLDSISKNSGQYGANQSAISFDENEYRYIRVTDLTENGYLSDDDKKSIPKGDNEKYKLKKGDIVFARTGTPGLTYVFNENESNMDYAFAGYLIRYELTDDINSKYLSYFTQSYNYWSWIKSTQRSTTLSNINASEFRSLPIIKPPLPEQRRIAEILSTVDDAIQKTDEVIEKAERLKKGLMQDLLTKGIGHTEFKEVQIGPKKMKIPKEWDRACLESISKNSGQYGANQSAIPYDKKEYRYIRVTDLSENGRLSDEDKKSISKEGNEKYKLKKNDIVFARTGTPGLTYVFNENDSNVDYAFAGYLIRFELKRDMFSKYLSYYTQSYHYWSWIKSTQRSTTLSNINASEFRTLPIPLPPLPEQRRIAEILSSLDCKIQKERSYKERLQHLKKGLMQDLLTGKVRTKNLT